MERRQHRTNEPRCNMACHFFATLKMESGCHKMRNNISFTFPFPSSPLRLVALPPSTFPIHSYCWMKNSISFFPSEFSIHHGYVSICEYFIISRFFLFSFRLEAIVPSFHSKVHFNYKTSCLSWFFFFFAFQRNQFYQSHAAHTFQTIEMSSKSKYFPIIKMKMRKQRAKVYGYGFGVGLGLGYWKRTVWKCVYVKKIEIWIGNSKNREKCGKSVREWYNIVSTSSVLMDSIQNHLSVLVIFHVFASSFCSFHINQYFH